MPAGRELPCPATTAKRREPRRFIEAAKTQPVCGAFGSAAMAEIFADRWPFRNESDPITCLTASEGRFAPMTVTRR
jgi:hypothetical protein